MALRFDCTEPAGRRRGIDRAVTSVGLGELVCFPVESSYAVGCDAFSHIGTDRLRAVKGHGRRTSPPVMVGHPRTLDGVATGLSTAARDLVAAFWPGPLTLLCRSQPTLDWDLGDGGGSGGTVAVRVPLHPIALELLERTGPMAVTGANPPGVSRQPLSCTEVREAFGDDVDVYLNGGHLTGAGVWGSGPSTVVDVTGEVPRLLRAGAVDVATLREVVPDLVAEPADAPGTPG